MKDLMLVRSDSQEASEGLAMLDPRKKQDGDINIRDTRENGVNCWRKFLGKDWMSTCMKQTRMQWKAGKHDFIQQVCEKFELPKLEAKGVEANDFHWGELVWKLCFTIANEIASVVASLLLLCCLFWLFNSFRDLTGFVEMWFNAADCGICISQSIR